MNINNVFIKTYFLFFFVNYLWPDPIFACQCRDRISYVKTNMHILQTIVETYAEENNGFYPKSVEVLYQAAKEKNYWKTLRNPYTRKTDFELSLKNMASWKKLIPHSPPKYLFGLRVLSLQEFKEKQAESTYAGLLLYEYKMLNSYKIYGLDGEGKPIVDDEQIFYLSNE